MKKPVFIALVALTTFLGAFLNFYAFNLFCSDVANFFMQGNFELQIISTFPALNLAVIMIVVMMFLMRYYSKPTIVKRLSFTYSIIIASLSFVGLVTSILTGTIVHGSFLSERILPCYPLIGLIVHGIIFIGSLVLMFLTKKYLPEDKDRTKVTFRYVLATIGHATFLFFVFNRVGAVLWMPSYLQVRTLYVTWSFYLWTLLPLAMLVLLVLEELQRYKSHKRYGIISNSVMLGVNIVVGVGFAIMELNDTTIGAAISPVMPLSRLASMPVEAILIFLIMVIWPLLKLIKAIRMKEDNF